MRMETIEQGAPMTRYQEVRAKLEVEPKTWLITGVAGFIGSHLLETLLELNQTVVGLDNFATGSPRNLADVAARVGRNKFTRFLFMEGDIRDLSACQLAAQGVDVVLHEAALGSVPRSMADPLSTHCANVDGFINVLMAAHAAQVKRVVYASSSSVYGDDPSKVKVETRLGRPLSPYATSKLIDETYADTFHRTHGIESVGLRYFNVFGPRQDPSGPYAAVIPRWTEQLFRGEQCTVYGDGSNSRDFCFVDNVVQANLLAACAPSPDVTAGVFNVACGARTTLTELYAAIRHEVAAFDPSVSDHTLRSEAPRPGDVPHSLASIERACNVLGYEPSHDVSQGLKRTVGHYAVARHATGMMDASVNGYIQSTI
jgi:UDP-N-acetylglucosamine 4-epimerase